jgi:hypothetical protein
MTSKALLRKRLGVAIGKPLSPKEFTWFFAYFCEKNPQHSEYLRSTQIDANTEDAFSHFAGYDLRFPIPIPLLIQLQA